MKATKLQDMTGDQLRAEFDKRRVDYLAIGEEIMRRAMEPQKDPNQSVSNITGPSKVPNHGA